MALDLLLETKKNFVIQPGSLPIIRILVKLSICKKYNECKFDSELLDLVELSDQLNKGVK